MIPTSPTTGSLVDATPRSLGRFEVGAIALGTWRLTQSDIGVGRRLIEAGLANGFNLVDAADVYGLDWGGTGFGSCEAHLGQVFADSPDLRDQVILATKGGIIPGLPYDSSDGYLQAAVDASLNRLQTDRIDLYQIHRPDLFTSPQALAATMVSLRDQSKVLEFGVSNFTPAQFSALQHHLPYRLVSTQPQFSAAHLDPIRDGTLDQCMTNATVPLAWSPLHGGALVSAAGDAGGVRPQLVATLQRLATRENTDRATIAIAFVLAHPARPIPILGTTQPERVAAAAEAAKVNLDRADCYDIIEASEGAPLP